MGVIRVTTRPHYYAKLEEEKKKQIPEKPKESFGTVTLHFRVADAGLFSNTQQKRLKPIVSAVLQDKGQYVRDYNSADDRGYYLWDGFQLHGNEIIAGPFYTNAMERVLQLLQALDAAGYKPEDEILVTYYPERRNMDLLYNLANILKSRRALVEQALDLKEPLRLIVTWGLALSITLGAFSYTAVEAVAFLIEHASKMAMTTGKSRMKPCDMSNPKFQMRSWLLRLGFIGQQYERPRKTLLDGLSGDAAFFSEEQKARAVARRKAKKMNEEVNREPA